MQKVEHDVARHERGAQAQELYARFGLASQRAQLLEQRLAFLLCTAFGDTPAVLPWPEIEEMLKERSSKTFGHLVKVLGQHPAADPALLEELGNRVEDRNYLAHRFFWTNKEALVDAGRRPALVQELIDLADRFRSSNENLRRIFFAWLQANGVSAAEAERVLAEKRAQVKIT